MEGKKDELLGEKKKTHTVEEFGEVVIDEAIKGFSPSFNASAAEKKRAQLNFYVGLVRLIVGVELGRQKAQPAGAEPHTEAGPSAAWRPIESAPRDEGDILLWGEDRMGAQRQFVGGWWPVAEDWATVDGEVIRFDATHWMPLPAPPAENSADVGAPTRHTLSAQAEQISRLQHSLSLAVEALGPAERLFVRLRDSQAVYLTPPDIMEMMSAHDAITRAVQSLKEEQTAGGAND
jgi:hypothetical protein